MSDTPYLDWAANYATGVAAAADKTARARAAAQPMSVANRGRLGPCGIKGCKRNAYKGKLCRAHWKLVPYQSKAECMVACFKAERETAAKFHRRFLREVRLALSPSTSPNP